jgi:hypothetical protein
MDVEDHVAGFVADGCASQHLSIDEIFATDGPSTITTTRPIDVARKEAIWGFCHRPYPGFPF